MVLRSTVSRAVMLLLLVAGPLVGQQHEHGTAANGQFGSVQFATSCSSEAQPQFNRAVALLHSFEFAHAIEGFTQTLQKDPSCAMAEWGIGLSRWGNPFAVGIRPAAPLQLGRDAVNRATTIGMKTPRERGYLDAVSQLYANFETTEQRARVLAYRDAMAKSRGGEPERCRGVDLPRVGDCRRRFADRQELCGPAAGRCDSREDRSPANRIIRV